MFSLIIKGLTLGSYDQIYSKTIKNRFIQKDSDLSKLNKNHNIKKILFS